MKRIDPMTSFQIVVIISIVIISLLLFLILKAIEAEALNPNKYVQ